MLGSFFLFFRVAGSSYCVGADSWGFRSAVDCSGAILERSWLTGGGSLDVYFLCRHRGVLGNGDMSGGKGICVAIYGGTRIRLSYFIHLPIFTINFKRA